MTSAMNSANYNATAKMLHWLVAGLIVLQFVLAKMADLAGDADSPLRELALLANHKSVGITILALAMARIVWRFKNPPPALPATIQKWQVMASHASHWSLYLLLFAMPISGWLMSSASAYSVSWFNLFQLPDFVAPNPVLKGVFEGIHETLAKLLILVATIHIGAALKHAVIDKDGVLQRIVSAVSVTAFAAVVGLGVAWLGGAGKSAAPDTAQTETPVNTAAQSADATPVTAAEVSSSLPLWQIDYDASYIRFIGDQAGADFEGVWASWSADMRFAADNLGASNFDVTIDATSADTQDEDRDSTLADPEWFDSMNFPDAYFRTNRFSAAEGGSFLADGQLTIKSLASPVQLLFTITETGNSRLLSGTAQLDRLALGVGTGEWEDTEWVGQDVTVEVHVEATINN